MKRLVLVFLILHSTFVFSEERLCPVVESKGEGHWPLDEEVFNKENADKALNRLKELILDSQHKDFKSVLPSCAVDNSSVIIKGYLLKRDLSLKKNSAYYKNQVDMFCNFLKNEAYTCH